MMEFHEEKALNDEVNFRDTYSVHDDEHCNISNSESQPSENPVSEVNQLNAFDYDENLPSLAIPKFYDSVYQITSNLTHDDLNQSMLQAAFLDQLDIVKECVDKGAEVNFIDKVGRRAIHYAVCGGSSRCVEYLLEMNSEINCQDFKQWTPVLIAVVRSHVTCLSLLLKYNADISLGILHNCAPSRRIKTMSRPIHFAAFKGNIQIIELLCSHGQSVNETDSSMRIPLHYAAYGKNIENFIYLIKRTANINAVDCHGRSALHVAALAGRVENVKLLIEAGADCKLKDIWDLTPVNLAIIRKHTAVVDYLRCFSDLVLPSVNQGCSAIENSTLRTLSYGLEEKNISQLTRTIRRIGWRKALHYYYETLKIFKSGGPLTTDKQRYKTKGGIFYSLIKNDCSKQLNNLTREDYTYIKLEAMERKSAIVIRRNQIQYQSTGKEKRDKSDSRSDARNASNLLQEEKYVKRTLLSHDINLNLQWLKRKMEALVNSNYFHDQICQVDGTNEMKPRDPCLLFQRVPECIKTPEYIDIFPKFTTRHFTEIKYEVIENNGSHKDLDVKKVAPLVNKSVGEKNHDLNLHDQNSGFPCNLNNDNKNEVLIMKHKDIDEKNNGNIFSDPVNSGEGNK